MDGKKFYMPQNGDCFAHVKRRVGICGQFLKIDHPVLVRVLGVTVYFGVIRNIISASGRPFWQGARPSSAIGWSSPTALAARH